MAPKDRLIYLALGGAGEIGMNFYLYGYGPAGKERFIAVDVGVTFPDMDGSPGVDLIMADPAWIAARAERLDAIFITHAHEDHVGALGMLWDRLRAPVYARRFTAAIAQSKMERSGQDRREVRETPPWPHMVEAGPFRVGFMPISHSIPECSSLVIETPAGRVLHTADFKIDPTPVVGDAFDEAAFRALGDAGVKAMVCDSTNVFSPRPGRSEATLAEPVTALMREAEGLVAATTFASNVARLKTLATAGRAAGRRVVVLGRAMRTMIQTARDTGVLTDFPATLSPEEAQDFRRAELMLLVTGSQGERRAASAQLAVGRYMGFELQAGDLFLFSSKTIPGNEKSVARILNALSERGVRTVDDSSEAYHVSGHANRPDLAAMQALVRPGAIVPMHGEHRHLSAHAAFAAERGFPAAVAPNGVVLDLTGDRPEIVDHVETGRTYLDGRMLIGATDGVVRDRMRMALRGHLSVSIVIDESGAALGDAWVEATGLPPVEDLEDGLEAAVEEEIGAQLRRVKRGVLGDDGALEELVTRVTARACDELVGKKPVVSVMISRLEP